MGKKIVLFLLLLFMAAIAIFFVFKKDLLPWLKSNQEIISNDPSLGSLKRDIEVSTNRIFTADEPLRKKEKATSKPSDKLNYRGIIQQTNLQRSENNLPDLKESDALKKAAELKIDDMLEKQYFEHISPTGAGPSDLAKQVSYDFVIIGENLALGDFTSNEDLVAGWMASPGHRENILRNGYEEIGVAVRQGVYEGRLTWLAVQEFGTPSISCPKPDTMLTKLIDDSKLELTKQDLVINQKKTELNAYEPKDNSVYAQLVQEYNSLVVNYNALAEETKLKVGEYNSQAEVYNDCLLKYSE